MIDFNGKQYNCPMEMTIDLIGGKWKALILWNLSDGCKRFNELQRLLHNITQKMLTQQLRDMEKTDLYQEKFLMKYRQELNISLLTLEKHYCRFYMQ
jgi:DNA-binding HxlR family transcriptional regulator